LLLDSIDWKDSVVAFVISSAARAGDSISHISDLVTHSPDASADRPSHSAHGPTHEFHRDIGRRRAR